MRIYGHILQILSITSILPLFLLSCGSDRVNIEFKTSPQIYVDDSKTDPDKLNRELGYDLRQAEKKRLQKQREAEAAAKAKVEAERKVKEEQTTEEEAPQSEEAEQPAPQQ